MSMMARGCIALLLVSMAQAAPAPEDFPRFIVPGHERKMESLRALFWLHYEPAGPLIPLWDEWMPMSTLWPATGSGAQLDVMSARWAEALAARKRGLLPGNSAHMGRTHS